VVAQVADEIAVMYLGRIVEQAPACDLLKSPRHPYTRGLLEARPTLHGRKKQRLPSIAGRVPSPADRPTGCAFHPRCQHNERGRCDVGGPPALTPLSSDHHVACIRTEEI
jgi:oligopeptide/dipeptide ABC transporter ATP-binding protein